MKNRLSVAVQKEYLSKYYIDSYKIASQFRIGGMELMDDERENLALAALEAAIKKFDPTKHNHFTSFLYTLVKNKILDVVKKKTRASKKGLPFSTQLVIPFSSDTDEDGSPDDAINDAALFHLGYGIMPQSNPRLYEQLTNALKTLTPRQQLLADFLMFPENALKGYKKSKHLVKAPKRLTYFMIAELLSISYTMVHKELKKIRQVLKTTVDNSI